MDILKRDVHYAEMRAGCPRSQGEKMGNYITQSGRRNVGIRSGMCITLKCRLAACGPRERKMPRAPRERKKAIDILVRGVYVEVDCWRSLLEIRLKENLEMIRKGYGRLES